MSFKELTDFVQAEAIVNKLSPNEEAVWRSLCRAYSTKFNTALHLVKQMAPEEVALEVYESQLDDIDEEENIEKLLDVIYTLEDPNYDNTKNEDLDRYMEQIPEVEEMLIGKGEKKSLLEEPKPIDKNDPKGGGFIDMSRFNNTDNER